MMRMRHRDGASTWKFLDWAARKAPPLSRPCRPRSECAPSWRERLLARLTKLKLTLVIGRYARVWHLPHAQATLTEVVEDWRATWPRVVPMPYPSPRNIGWLRRHPRLEAELLPRLRERIAQLLAGGD